MFSTFFTIALLAASAFQTVLADFAINTPALIQCQDAKISWEATKGPYNLIVVPAENPCGDALADLGDHTGTSMTWKPTLPAGTKVQLSLEDVNGDEAWSGTITVGAGNDTSCVPGSAKPTTDVKPSVPTTLTVSPSTTLSVANPTTTTVLTTSSSVPSAVGGVGNAGANPFGSNSGALSSHRATAPVMIFAAFAAALFISL